MDKNTLSNYGWIVIAVLVLAVMIALATPFGSFIEQGVRATTEGLFDTSKNAVNSAFEDLGVQMEDQTFEDGYKAPNGENQEPISCTHTNTKTEGTITATCITSGHTGKTICIDCGKTIANDAIIPALTHTTNDGICNNCNTNVKVTSFQIQLEYPSYETFQMDEGMTFGEWCLSAYNTKGFYVSTINSPCVVLNEYEDGIFTYIGGSGFGFVYDTDPIQSGHQYILSEGGHHGGGMN